MKTYKIKQCERKFLNGYINKTSKYMKVKEVESDYSSNYYMINFLDDDEKYIESFEYDNVDKQLMDGYHMFINLEVGELYEINFKNMTRRKQNNGNS